MRRTMSTDRRSAGAARIVLAAALCWAALSPRPASAEGALAIGLPRDVANEGVALGYAVNQPTAAAAEAEALRQCREMSTAPPATRSLCALVHRFKGDCVSIATDPQDGTPGVGWAVASTREGAEDAALANCRETAGADRRQHCATAVTRCDGGR